VLHFFADRQDALHASLTEKAIPHRAGIATLLGQESGGFGTEKHG